MKRRLYDGAASSLRAASRSKVAAPQAFSGSRPMPMEAASTIAEGAQRHGGDGEARTASAGGACVPQSH